MPDVPKIAKLAPIAADSHAVARLGFSGSFQCRLATEGDPTDRKPTDKRGVYGQFSVGQTFAYQEYPFDRVIRFAWPLKLRNALIDPWDDVKISFVEVATQRGVVVPQMRDALLGKGVSPGDARFSTKLGKDMGGKEAITGLSLSLGGGMVMAEADDPPPLCKDWSQEVKAWALEYQNRKPKLVAAARDQMDPVRRDYLEEIRESDGEFGHVNESSYEFMKIGTYIGPLKNVRVNVDSGMNPKGWPAQPLSWTIDMTFFRYDHDTLTGRVEGQIYAMVKS